MRSQHGHQRLPQREGMIELAAGPLRATIDPEHGFQCASLRHDDWDVLAEPGMQVSFPWVGLGGARPTRVALHGAVVAIGGGQWPPTHAAWAVQDSGRDAHQAWVTAQMRTVASDDAYPFDTLLIGTWRVDSEGLHFDVNASNRGKRHAPFGFGVRAALGALGDAVEVIVPAEDRWQCGADHRPSASIAVSVADGTDLRRPVRLSRPLNARFTRRQFANLQTQLAVLDPRSGREVWLNTSADFREAVSSHRRGVRGRPRFRPRLAGHGRVRR